jgi:hypothetical protein
MTHGIGAIGSRKCQCMLGVWFVFLFASFLVSLLTMNYFHFRYIFRRRVSPATLNLRSWRGFFEFFWTQRAPYQRVLLWTGIVAFFLTQLGAVIATIIVRIR